jgi:glycosyltransferase involved in cell wall biosynthesis
VREKMQNPEIAVLLPCYNEEITISKVVRDFKAALPSASIYVYDNNSSDNTAQLAKDAGAIVRHEPRQGKGNVIRAMFQEIDADVYVMADGDDTYPAEDSPAMVQKILEGYDMVIGDRLSSTYFQENKRPFHNVGNKMVRGAINHLFSASISDIMTGYRAFSFTFVKTYPVLSKGFEIETEMTIHSLDRNVKIYELPVNYRDRPEGSVSKLNTVGDGIKVMSTIFRMIREYRPLPFFGTIGGLLSIVGLGFIISIFFDYWATGMVARFPTLIGAAFLVIAGILSFIAGFILDSLARKDREQHILSENLFSWNRRH